MVFEPNPKVDGWFQSMSSASAESPHVGHVRHPKFQSPLLSSILESTRGCTESSICRSFSEVNHVFFPQFRAAYLNETPLNLTISGTSASTMTSDRMSFRDNFANVTRRWKIFFSGWFTDSPVFCWWFTDFWCGYPSGNQTWLAGKWTIYVIFLLKSPFIEDFPLPCYYQRVHVYCGRFLYKKSDGWSKLHSVPDTPHQSQCWQPWPAPIRFFQLTVRGRRVGSANCGVDPIGIFAATWLVTWRLGEWFGLIQSRAGAAARRVGSCSKPPGSAMDTSKKKITIVQHAFLKQIVAPRRNCVISRSYQEVTFMQQTLGFSRFSDHRRQSRLTWLKRRLSLEKCCILHTSVVVAFKVYWLK